MSSSPPRAYVKRIVHAQAADIFDARTDPAAMAQWMTPSGMAAAEVDLRVGGRFRLVMADEHLRIEHVGEYQVIQPPELLVFTWRTEFTGGQDTLVTVRLVELGSRETEIEVTHQFATDAEAESRLCDGKHQSRFASAHGSRSKLGFSAGAWPTRDNAGRSVAALIRMLGDVDLADTVQDAFAVALHRWPTDGLPPNPGAWITTTARNRARDRLRRDSRERLLVAQVATEPSADAPQEEEEPVQDDRLRLIFTCCHPALSPEARVSLTLRLLGGLSTKEVARAFLISEPTIAQRLVRAKHKIKAARIPNRVPPEHELFDSPPRSPLSDLFDLHGWREQPDRTWALCGSSPPGAHPEAAHARRARGGRNARAAALDGGAPRDALRGRRLAGAAGWSRSIVQWQSAKCTSQRRRWRS